MKRPIGRGDNDEVIGCKVKTRENLKCKETNLSPAIITTKGESSMSESAKVTACNLAQNRSRHPWNVQFSALRNTSERTIKCTRCSNRRKYSEFPNQKQPCFDCRTELKQPKYQWGIMQCQ